VKTGMLSLNEHMGATAPTNQGCQVVLSKKGQINP